MPRFEQRSRRRFFPALVRLLPSLLLCMAAAGPALGAGSASARAAERAREALDRGRIEKALERARQAFELAETDDEKAEAWILAGRVRLEAAAGHEARAQTLKGRRFRSGSRERSDAELREEAAAADELGRAEAAFRQALAIAPRREARVHLARIHFWRGDVERARDELATAGDESEDEVERELRRCLGAVDADRVLDLDGEGVEGELVPPEKVSYPQPRPSSVPPNGFVVIRSVIDPNGDVVCAQKVVSSSDDLTRASIEALRQWRFEPATLDGEPVPVQYYLTINFRRE